MGGLGEASTRGRSRRHTRLPDGRLLGYADWGDPAGAPVIYCHGGLSSRVDIAWASRLCAEHGVRLIAPDRPGIGLSQFQPDRTLLDWPRDVVHLADALEIERFAVLGWSLGAVHALACAYAIPEQRLTRTATVGAPVPLDDAAAGKQVGFLTDRILGGLSNSAPALAGVALSAMKLVPPAVVKWSLLGDCSASDKAVIERLTTGRATGYFYEALRNGPAGEVQEYRVMYAPWGFSPEQIPGEVQLWQGEDDALALPVNGHQLAARIPHATLHMVPSAGHYLLHIKAADVFDGLTR